MTPISPRTARLRSWLVLAAVASLAFANATRAGGLTFPFADGGACNDPNDVLLSLIEPSTAFDLSSPKTCVSKCKRVVSDCKQYVNNAVGCQLALLSDYAFYRKQACKEFFDGADEQLCLDELTSFVAGEKASTKGTRDARRVDCEAWGATCLASCLHP